MPTEPHTPSLAEVVRAAAEAADGAGARARAREVRDQGRRAGVRRLDLADLQTVQQTIGELAEALGRIDVLVNNAGTGSSSPFLELPLDEWQYVIDVDLTGAYLTA